VARLLIFHQVTTTLRLTSNINHNRQYRVKKYIPNSLTNTIHGKNAKLSLRLDTHLSSRRGGHKEARNDTCQGLSSWAGRDRRRSRKDDQDPLVSNRGRKIFGCHNVE
jgi:hypothetical protein